MKNGSYNGENADQRKYDRRDAHQYPKNPQQISLVEIGPALDSYDSVGTPLPNYRTGRALEPVDIEVAKYAKLYRLIVTNPHATVERPMLAGLRLCPRQFARREAAIERASSHLSPKST